MSDTKWIKAHQGGEIVYINLAGVRYIWPRPDGSSIIVWDGSHDGKDFIYVKEAPRELLLQLGSHLAISDIATPKRSR